MKHHLQPSGTRGKKWGCNSQNTDLQGKQGVRNFRRACSDTQDAARRLQRRKGALKVKKTLQKNIWKPEETGIYWRVNPCLMNKSKIKGLLWAGQHIIVKHTLCEQQEKQSDPASSACSTDGWRALQKLSMCQVTGSLRWRLSSSILEYNGYTDPHSQIPFKE